MYLYSTKNASTRVSLKHAVMTGLPEDNGLYMPENIHPLPAEFFEKLPDYSFPQLSYEVCKHLFEDALIDKLISEDELCEIVNNTITFDAPIVSLDEGTHIQELFHGPSLAFKDFGARFMAGLMGHFARQDQEKLVILVATSGDTGGAVAAGFLGAPDIEVVILYPSGKVSYLQEKQLTTLGQNITALEIDGTFDDCQKLVKTAFLDKELTGAIKLTSANSINIARLIPQSLYYFRAYQKLENKELPVVFSIPSGNFGNLTAGLLAQRMGLPIAKFIAATNVNDVVPQYLKRGEFSPKPSVQTISNAMDVGNPSNFARMQDLFESDWQDMCRLIEGFAFDDQQTRDAMQHIYDTYKYVMDPHGAVGYLALRQFQEHYPHCQGVILETAHPSKFLDVVEPVINRKVDIPTRLSELADKKKASVEMEVDYQAFKQFLKKNYS
ncbi:MAG: threonine synthase [Bacteroidota bacterium]